MPIVSVLLNKFVANGNTLLTAYICKALGRLCDGQREIAEMVLNAGISSYLLFLYWQAVDNERERSSKNDVDDVLFEDIFGLLGLLAYYERPQSLKLLSPLPTYPSSTLFVFPPEESSKAVVKHSKRRADDGERSIAMQGPKRTDAEVYAEQERVMQSYMKRAPSTPDLVDIIAVVLDLVLAPTTSQPPASTDWYYVQCAAWQISMILTNGMAVRDSIYRRQRLINALVFHKMLRLIDQYADVMPAACLCALSQALSYSVLGASSAQIGYLVCCGIVHTLLLIISHGKTTRKCLLCVLHAMNAILSMGERDRMPGKRRASGEWGDEDDDWDDELDEYGDEEEDWEDDEEDDFDFDSSEDEYMLVAESEKRRKGEGDEGEERRRGVRRRRKRQGNDRRAREKSERRHAKQEERKDPEPGSARGQRINRAKTSRDASPTRPLQSSQPPLTADAANPSPLPAFIQSPATPTSTTVSTTASTVHTHTDSAFCKSCHACLHYPDKPPPYPSALSTSALPFPLPGNGYVSILRVYSAETMFHRLELSTSKRSSKEDQALLALIRKLLSYFQHTTDARVSNPFLRLNKDEPADANASTAAPPATAPTSDTATHSATTAVSLPPEPIRQWSPPTEPLAVIPPSEWSFTVQTSETAADITTSSASTVSDTASTSSDLSTSSTASTSASVSFCRPRDNVLLRTLHRARTRQQQRLSRQQYEQKRREVRFLLTGIRGELPAAFNSPPQQPQAAKPNAKEKSRAKEAAKEQTAASAAAKAAKSEASKKASIEELIRQMQEKERVLTAMQESKKAELRELKEKEKEIKERKEREKTAKAAREVKEESKEAEAANSSTASVQQEEDEVGDEEDDEDEDKSSPVASEDRARRKKGRKDKKKEKAKAGRKKVPAKAKVKVDYKAAAADGSAEVDDVIERMREERRREQEEMEKRRVEAGLQTAAQERVREAEEEKERAIKREEQQKLEKERKEREEQKRREDEVRRKEEEVKKKEERRKAEEEKEKRRLKQIEEDKEKEKKRVERERLRVAEEKKRREEDEVRLVQEKAKAAQKAAEAAALALAYSKRPLYTCRYADCPHEYRILASEHYVVLTCSTQCRIRYHHRRTSSLSSPAAQLSTCWETAQSLFQSGIAGSPCPTADCAGVLQSASLYHAEDELIEHIVAPPPPVERAQQPLTETKVQKRERKRAERQKAEQASGVYAAEEKKEADAETAVEVAAADKRVYRGGLEVLVPFKEKESVPVIPRPALFAAAADEMKEKTLLPVTPLATVASAGVSTNGTAAAAAPHSSERKKGRQARKTRIDIFLPEAEPEEEEPVVPAAAEEESVQSQPTQYPVEMTNTAYGGFVRCYTNSTSTSPLLYCRCLSSSMDDDSVIQWMVSQCAMLAPIYVTRFFAPSAVLVQYSDVQTAVKAYHALSSAMYMQFAIEPCSIVSGDEVRAVQSHQELMMSKLRKGMQQQEAQPFDPSAYLYDSRQPAISESTLPALDTVPSAPATAAPSAGSVYAGFFERENAIVAEHSALVSGVADDDLDTEQFDFSFLAIGADEFDAHSTSPPTSDSPPTPLHVDKRSVSGTTPFSSFGSSWSAPIAESSAGSSWASPSLGPSPAASFSTLPVVSSVFSPIPASASTPAAPTPLFTPTSPSHKPATIASLTPALDPVLSSPSTSFTSPTSPPDTVSSHRRSISSVAPLFSSTSLFSSAAASQSSPDSSSSSSVFSLPSFSMFSSLTRSISITDDTSTESAAASTSAPSFFSSAASAVPASAQLLHVPSTSSLRQSLSSSVSDEDDEEVWNDEKMSRLVLKSDAEDEEEDSGLTAIPTHPRHDSIDDSAEERVLDSVEDERDASDVRTNSDSIGAYDQDIDRDFSQRSELPVEEEEQLQYDSRQPQPRYNPINTSPSPRFTRSVYTPAAVPQAVSSLHTSSLVMPPYAAHQPSMLHGEAAMAAMYGGGMVHGWNGNVSPSPGYAPYNSYNGYAAIPPTAHYYPYAQYSANAAMYMQQQQQQQQMSMMVGRQQQHHRLVNRAMAAPKTAHPLPAGMSGTNPLASVYTPQAGMGQMYAPPQARPADGDDASPTDASAGRDDRRRGKRGYVVDLDEFPTLGGALTAAQPTVAAGALSPSSAASPSSSASQSAAYTSHAYTAPSPHEASHADANGNGAANGEGGAGWTGALANKLKGGKEDKRPGTAGSSSASNAGVPPPGSPPSRQLSATHTAAPSSASSTSPPSSVVSTQTLSASRLVSGGGKQQASSSTVQPPAAQQAAASTPARQPQQPASVQQKGEAAGARKDNKAGAEKAASGAKQPGRASGGSGSNEWTEVVSAGKKKKR